MLVNFGYYYDPEMVKLLVPPLRGMIYSCDDIPDLAKVQFQLKVEKVVHLSLPINLLLFFK